MLNENEKYKFEIISSAICGKITNQVASRLLGLTKRQVQRMKTSVKKLGEVGVIHKLKGRKSNNFFGVTFKENVLNLVVRKYSDFKPSFASEKLLEFDNVSVKPETLRLWMIEADLWKARKKKQYKYFSLRERKDYFGEMLQFDGSYHMWFEDRLLDSEGYPVEVCLLASIDDATGKIHLKFDLNESVMAVFSFWRDYIKEFGKPISIYLDKYSTYKVNHKNAVDNFELLTQFQKVLNVLDIKMINAHTPQAKGRVERLFGTLQDRLTKELRLNNINTINEANIYLEKIFINKYNNKFSVPADKSDDLHRKLTNEEIKNLNSIFSVKNKRIVNNDFTVKFKGKLFQLERLQPVTIMQRQEIETEEWLNGEIKIKYKNKYLNYFTLRHKPPKQKINPLILTTHKTNYTPPKNHPWRNFKF